MSTAPRHSVPCVGVAIDDAGRVLVIQRRDNGAWEPPGGVLELDETPEQGTVREVLEETGVHVAVQRLVSVQKNMPRGVVSLIFRCHPVGGSPGPTDEATSVVWLEPQEAMSRMVDVHASRVHAAVCNPDSPVLVTHNGTNLLNVTRSSHPGNEEPG